MHADPALSPGERAATCAPDPAAIPTGNRGGWIAQHVQGPRLSDPRLRVAAVLLSVQALGQIALGFQLSIAQIAISLLTAGVLDAGITLVGSRILRWPGSALLTGNGVALILRVPGTEHGDWWSTRGWYVFAATSAVAVLSKFVMKVDARPLFNPSNLGLVLAFLVLGPTIADPQDLWWGPLTVGLALTYLVIVAGGLTITRRLRLLSVAASFWTIFGLLVAVLALAGHGMTARWNVGPVSGLQYWTTLALSPEILIFAFFMITDPRTVARGSTGRLAFGGAVAVAAAVLVSLQTTEYATKVALLAGLVVGCALRPLIERIVVAMDQGAPGSGFRLPRFAAVAAPVIACVVVVAGSAIAGPAGLGDARGLAADPPPAVRLARDQRPDVTLGPGAEQLADRLDRAALDQMAVDAASAVLVLDEAVAAGDRRMAATVARDPLLASVLDQPPSPAPDRTFRSAVVDVTRDERDFQSSPVVTVRFEGTVDGVAVVETYELAPVGSRQVLVRRTGP